MKKILIFLIILLAGCTASVEKPEIFRNSDILEVSEITTFPDSCEIGLGIICEEVQYKNDSRLGFLLSNDMGKDLKVTKITIGNNACDSEFDVLIEDTETIKFYVKCPTEEMIINGTIKKEITIDWYDAITGPSFPRENKGMFRLRVAGST